MTTTKTKTDRKPSEASVRFLTDLTQKRDVLPGSDAAESLKKLASWLAGPRTQREVSAMIDRALAKPKRGAAELAAPSGPYPSVPEAVPSSKFAILSELLTEIPSSWATQELLFFEVKELKGKRVVRRLVGAPGAFKRTFLPAALAQELFGHLESPAFAYQASKTFGEHYCVCGRCGAELTDDQSRDRQFGPICWDLMASFRAAAGF